jgi:hypothetical protein
MAIPFVADAKEGPIQDSQSCPSSALHHHHLRSSASSKMLRCPLATFLINCWLFDPPFPEPIITTTTFVSISIKCADDDSCSQNDPRTKANIQPPHVTDEDSKRTQAYKAQLTRAQYRHNFNSQNAFLASLQLSVNIRPMTKELDQRVLQLLERTNQMNAVKDDVAVFSGSRCHPLRDLLCGLAFEEVRSFPPPGSLLFLDSMTANTFFTRFSMQVFVVEVGDRFSHYGVVGAMHVFVHPSQVCCTCLLRRTD